MLKRLRWFLLGFIAGLIVYRRLQDRFDSLKDQYSTVRGAATTFSALRGIRRDLRDAWADGRTRIENATQRSRNRTPAGSSSAGPSFTRG